LKPNSISGKLKTIIANGPIQLFCAIGIVTCFAGPSYASVPVSYSCLRNFYVNGTTGTDVASAGSASSPWKTIQFANNSGVLRAGDCVNVAAGTYFQNGGLNLTAGGNANTATGYVTYIGAPNLSTHIVGSSNWFLINIQASYLIINGFDIDGTGIPDAAICDNPSPGGIGHHIQILNNAVHDSGGGGILLNHTDYFTISGNVVYNTAGKSSYQESGISVYEPQPITGFTAQLPADLAPFHIVISNNIVYNNTETSAIAAPHSDGNGIITDDWLDTQNAPNKPYPYKGLVQSNLVHDNGGRGIHVYLSANVTVANNTLSCNNQDTLDTGTWRGELSNAASNNVTWLNNIAWACPNLASPELQYNTAVLEGTYGNYSDANVVWKNNLTYDYTSGQASLNFNTPTGATEQSAFMAANKAGMNPQLSWWQPLSNSPVIKTGVATPSYPPLSLDGSAMPTPPDIGAY